MMHFAFPSSTMSSVIIWSIGSPDSSTTYTTTYIKLLYHYISDGGDSLLKLQKTLISIRVFPICINRKGKKTKLSYQ